MIKAFKALGFKETEQDPCFLYRKDCLIVVYVDDVGIAAPNQGIIDQLCEDLRSKPHNLLLSQEGKFEKFLGIMFEKQDDGAISCSQPGLIKKILDATNMHDCKVNSTPCTQTALGSDPDGAPMKETWNYASVVGMLLYLSTNTRTDISYAVSQVARFTTKPKQSHATAVKSIIRYLAGTINKGMILRPTSSMDINAYVDADFAGLYGQEPDDNVQAAQSRTGYVITIAKCPMLWKSQLQSEVA